MGRIVELVQAVLGELQEIHCSSVSCVGGLELLVLSLAILGGRCNLLVKCLDSIIECLNLRLEGANGLSLVIDGPHIVDKGVNHDDDARGLLALGLVCHVSLWRWGRSCLHEANASACDATRSLGGCQGAAHVEGDLLILGQLALWRSLVLGRIVELVQAVLGELQEIHCSSVSCVGGLELLVLSLAILGGRCNLLVKCLDSIIECLNLRLEGANGLSLVIDGSLEVRD